MNRNTNNMYKYSQNHNNDRYLNRNKNCHDNERIFFCHFCHFPHQVDSAVVIVTKPEKLQHLLHNDCHILAVGYPEE